MRYPEICTYRADFREQFFFFALEICRKFKQLPQILIFYLTNLIFAVETIQGRKLYEKIPYILLFFHTNNCLSFSPIICYSAIQWTLSSTFVHIFVDLIFVSTGIKEPRNLYISITVQLENMEGPELFFTILFTSAGLLAIIYGTFKYFLEGVLKKIQRKPEER